MEKKSKSQMMIDSAFPRNYFNDVIDIGTWELKRIDISVWNPPKSIDKIYK